MGYVHPVSIYFCNTGRRSGMVGMKEHRAGHHPRAPLGGDRTARCDVCSVSSMWGSEVNMVIVVV